MLGPKHFKEQSGAACLSRVILTLALLAALGVYALTTLWLAWPFAFSLALALTCATLTMLLGLRLLSQWASQPDPETDDECFT